MKKYTQLAHIADIDSSTFFNKVSSTIEEYQTRGLTVEVQYQTADLVYSALILGYKEEV